MKSKETLAIESMNLYHSGVLEAVADENVFLIQGNIVIVNETGLDSQDPTLACKVVSWGRSRELAEAISEVILTRPTPLLLWCPQCGGRHEDVSEPHHSEPHHTHACQHCGMVWRPAVENTVGVKFLPGFRNAT